MNIMRKGDCKNCMSNQFSPDTCIQVGEKVIEDTCVGRGYSQTEYIFYQCLTCGIIWKKYCDSGAGGSGKYQNKLDCF